MILKRYLIVCWKEDLSSYLGVFGLFRSIIHQMLHVITLKKTNWLDLGMKCPRNAVLRDPRPAES
jgi:hypothetical protein